MSTIVIAIIAMIVLIIIVAFFLGGFSALGEKIASIFKGGAVGQDFAIQQCTTFCERAEELETNLQKSSDYCKTTFSLDLDGDGKADTFEKDGKKITVKYHCDGTDNTGRLTANPLEVPCSVSCV